VCDLFIDHITVLLQVITISYYEKVFLIFLYIIFCFADDPSESEPSLQELTEMAKEIKKKANTWKPMDPKKSPFRKYTKAQRKRALAMPGIDPKTMDDDLKIVNAPLIAPELLLSGAISIAESVARTARTEYTFPENYNWTKNSSYGDL
jgi:hypothetical protein